MENNKTACVKKFNVPDMLYGDYVRCEDNQIEEAKAELLEQMIDSIRVLAKKDEFWIVKRVDDNEYTVGWKAMFPQMAQNDSIKNDGVVVIR